MVELKKEHSFRIPLGADLKYSLLLTLWLFAFWVVLSGKLEARYLIIGFLTALGVTVITRPFSVLSRDGAGGGAAVLVWGLPWLRLLAFLPWLFCQLVKSSVLMAWLILHPKMPVDPQVIRFEKHFPHPVGYFVLANSITLTPGTLTVDVEDGRFTVHCVHAATAGSLAPAEREGEMPRRVGDIFGAGREVDLGLEDDDEEQ
ncbi:MAG: Na+/H+ antiporter subunit E [Bacillota bacterium]